MSEQELHREPRHDARAIANLILDHADSVLP